MFSLLLGEQATAKEAQEWFLQLVITLAFLREERSLYFFYKVQRRKWRDLGKGHIFISFPGSAYLLTCQNMSFSLLFTYNWKNKPLRWHLAKVSVYKRVLGVYLYVLPIVSTRSNYCVITKKWQQVFLINGIISASFVSQNSGVPRTPQEMGFSSFGWGKLSAIKNHVIKRNLIWHCVCKCVYKYVYICMHTHIYIHIQREILIPFPQLLLKLGTENKIINTCITNSLKVISIPYYAQGH